MTGTRGNDIKTAVSANIDDESAFDVITYLGTDKVDTQTVKTAAELKDSDFCRFQQIGRAYCGGSRSYDRRNKQRSYGNTVSGVF